MNTEPKILQIPMRGGSGEVRTGAIQFENDWPGLFIRGDNAIVLCLGFEDFRNAWQATLTSWSGRLLSSWER